jgi:hypothetical protein
MGLLRRIFTILRALLRPSASLGKFPPDWYRAIKYPTETLMMGGIRIVDPFQGSPQTRLWIDGRGRYTLAPVDENVSFADV